MTDMPTLLHALDDAGRAMRAPGPEGGLEGTLRAIAHAARDSVRGFEHVGVTVVQRDGGITTMASTGRLVREMDSLQYEFDQGPCMDALRQGPVVLVEDLPSQADTWPMYTPRASEAGVQAQMGVQVHDSDETLGGLNFYSTADVTIDPDAPRRAELFAAHAAIALAHARRLDDASEAIRASRLIGPAVGILMERFHITEDQAMHYLVRVSTAAGLEVRDVAREMADQVNREAE